MIIAIDGPSGAGKSTLGKMLAKRLGLLYIDTGAMYRAVAWAVLNADVSADDEDKVIEIARSSQIDLSGEPENLRVTINGQDISEEIRTREVGQASSIISAISQVRRILVERQQQLGRGGKGCVLDGRDIGTVVFPDADVKFFLTAAAEARAERRFKEDVLRGLETSYETTLAEIRQRDQRDTTRADSPLTVADDAIEIDTSDLELSEVLAIILSKIPSH
jgi:cytidylate kinase